MLELILTFTILGLVLLMIFGALRLGSAAWERGEDRTEKYQRRRIVSDLLSQQLKSAFAYKIKAKKAESDYLAFLGQKDSLRFVSTFSMKAKRSEGLVFVIYQVEEGNSSGKILKIYEARVLNKDFMEETPGDDKFLPLIEGISDLTFEYFEEPKDQDKSGEWSESWDAKDKKGLPSQVRLLIKWKEKKEEWEAALPTQVALPAYVYDDRGKQGAPSLPRPPVRP